MKSARTQVNWWCEGDVTQGPQIQFNEAIVKQQSMQGQQPVLRQPDQQTLLQQTTSLVIKMNEVIQPITPVGEYSAHYIATFLEINEIAFSCVVPVLIQWMMHTRRHFNAEPIRQII